MQAFREGKITLEEIELQELGDIQGKSLLHLQCHFGLDTLTQLEKKLLALENIKK